MSSAVAVNRVAWDAHLRDLRHMEARAASALADWLEYLTVEGKAAGTLYQYTRQVAPLLRKFPEKALHEFTAAGGGTRTAVSCLTPDPKGLGR